MLNIEFNMPKNFLEIDETVMPKIGLPGAARIIRDDVRLHTPIVSGKTYDETVEQKESENSYIIHGKTQRTKNIISWLHKGTKAHIITPINKSVLRFAIGFRIIFSKFVLHPGTKATHYFQPSAQALVKLREFLKGLRIIK